MTLPYGLMPGLTSVQAQNHRPRQTVALVPTRSHRMMPGPLPGKTTLPDTAPTLSGDWTEVI